MKLSVYYSVENCGDGSAYPRFFATEELAEWHQDHLDEGWGESCTGSITMEGDNLTCSEARTAAQYYVDLVTDIWDEDSCKKVREFIAKFFPDGLPAFKVVMGEDNRYYDIMFSGERVNQEYVHSERSESGREALEVLLQNGPPDE